MAGGAALVEQGQRGIWRIPFDPQELYLHPEAYEVEMITTLRTVVNYTPLGNKTDFAPIIVRSKDAAVRP